MTRSTDVRRLVAWLAVLGLMAALLTALGSEPAAAGPGYQKPRTGQCRNLTYPEANARGNSTAPVSCSSRHTAQTIAVGMLPSRLARSKRTANQAALTRCEKAFNKAVGRSAKARLKSAFALRVFAPTKAQKRKGARWFRCDAILLRGRSLTPLTRTTKPLLAKPAPLNQALCITTRGSRPTTCDAPHGFKATHVFKLKGKAYPGKRKVKRAARKGCDKRVASTRFRFDWPSKADWQAGKKYVVCFAADETDPRIKITTPSLLSPGQNLVISGTVTDNEQVKSIQVTLRRDSDGSYLQDDLTFDESPNTLPVAVGGIGKANASFRLDIGTRSINTYGISVVASDVAGNLAEASRNVTVSSAPPGPGQVVYQMNESSGATTMTDSGGHGINGSINQAGLDTGISFGGATGYNWPFRNPTAPPASPERIVQVGDNARVDAGNDTFSVEIRYRTSNSFGNIIQKGQSTSVGGQWKIQAPGGKPSCLFKSSPGTSQQIAIQSTRDLSDNQWHVVRCLRSANNVKIYVDGALNGQKNAPASKVVGNIDNSLPLTIGGKLNCNNVSVGCDYFSGQIDYVKLKHS